MRLLRAATLVTPDPDAVAARYGAWMDYTVAERGVIDPALAASWDAPASAGRRYVVCRPASGADIFLRFVEGAAVPLYRPLRTYGWAAIELCVQDVMAVNARMQESPFKIIGPPRRIDGLPTIFPMQVEGPDGEIVYLTQIDADLPEYELPRAKTPIDHLFILVLGCSDLAASGAWLARVGGLQQGRSIDLVYTMLSQAFDLPEDKLHTIATLTHERDVFLEIDQYPAQATARPCEAGALAPGIALGSLLRADLDTVPGPWLSPPAPREGVLYGGRRTGVVRGPDGVLLELIEA
jgi:hypothetical protein